MVTEIFISLRQVDNWKKNVLMEFVMYQNGLYTYYGITEDQYFYVVSYQRTDNW